MSKKKKTNSSTGDEEFPLPVYKEEDDIYNREKEVPFGSEDQEVGLSRMSDRNPGDDLDIPGTELDDANENIGEEDEENNYYSLNDEKEDDINTRQ